MATEVEKLHARLERMRAEGMLRVSFFFEPGSKVTVEERAAEMNRVYAAVDAGQCEAFTFNDSNRPKTAEPPA